MVESILTHTSAVSFAGGRASEVLVGSGRAWGVSSPTQHPEPATMGCSSSLGGGEPQATLPCGVACGARGGPSLQAARPTQCTVVVRLVFGATGGGLALSPASGGAKCDDLRRSYQSACLQRRVANVVEADVARCPLIPRGMSCRMPCPSERRSAGSEGRTRRASGSKRAERPRRARIGRSNRLCSRVVCLVAEVDRRRRTQRSVRSPFHPI